MSFESALEHYDRARRGQTASLQELSKAASALPRAQDAAHFFGLEKAADAANESANGGDDRAWRESVLTLLADAVALGRELDRTNFYRDPQIGLALELVRQELRKDPVENNAFVARLLEIALENAKEIAASDVDNKGAKLLPDARRALAEDSWSVDEKKKAAVIGALVKSVQDTPVQNPIEQMSVGKGKSLAREVWKTIEPRCAFWDRAKSRSQTSASVQKFAGKTADQILRDAKELAAKTERECNEKLAKINGGNPSKDVQLSELQKSARSLSEELANFKDAHDRRITGLRDLRK
jgi:hypothetical protein